jgi:hypothetical protein
MPGSNRAAATAAAAVLVGTCRPLDALARAAEPASGEAPAVEFTPDGKMKRPVGYRHVHPAETKRSRNS